MLRKRIVPLCLALLLCAAIAQAEPPSAVPEIWNLIYEADDVLTAAKQAYITFNGQGYWDTVEIITAGFHVVDHQTEGNIHTLDVYGVKTSHDVSSGVAERVGAEIRPARIVLEQQENTYTLLSYQAPGDGTVLWDDMGVIFGEDTRALMIKNQEEYGWLALLDADAEAEKYIEYQKTGEAKGAWVELLQDGSIPGALEIIWDAARIGRYPHFAGKSVWYQYEKMYTLTVEGEMSFSGTLTYECVDAAGERLGYVKFKIQDGAVLVLEGTLPNEYE
ncbi:MAG: hypothetical protein LBM74_05670 [Oscillospiraceae bacterium]|jgi:hypothetical protein|nr:hypothetical protein [Oscillospiraceae bacterium]